MTDKYQPAHSSTSTDHESPFPTDTPQSRPRRWLTRRKLFLLVPGIAMLLFCVIFFPVYFTQGHTNGSSNANTTALQSAASLTAAGAVWQQKVRFTDLDDFRIEYYSSGQNNSQVLTGGLPKSAWSEVAPGSVQRRTARGARKGKGEKGRKGKGKGKKGKGKGRKERCEMKRQDSSTSSSRSSTRLSSSSASTTSSTSASTTKTTTHSTSTIPTTTSTFTRSTSATSTTASLPTSTPGSVLSIFYPAHSYTPSELPVGGTQFYALSPFDLSLASSITFNYTVFFPAYYDFVLGGKLPGLYGGTEGCGGGNSAEDCWSTRMAWRPDGVGELYAYLPQDQQNISALLEVPPYSYVNSDYGISLGRGAFNYTRGGWTTISQTVTLQTNKTHPNGVVSIAVNDETVISYDQVYYPTRIKGILFSTFFGGSTSDWATPTDQYSYFKDFSIRINAVRSKKA